MIRILLAFLLLFITTTCIAVTPSAKQNFLVFSDIHFDPFLYCTQKPCPLIRQLRQRPPASWSDVFNQYDKKPSHILQDTNASLLALTLAAAQKEAASSHPQFILILGDVLGHGFFNKYKTFSDNSSLSSYKDFVRNVMVYLAQQIRAAFPSPGIYYLVGNNDSCLGDYFTVPESPFFRETGGVWSSLIKNETIRASIMQQFDYAGYYAINFAQDPHARLIMLNSNVFSPKAKGKRVSEVAEHELAWLHAQLVMAKKNNQKVLIAMHIPETVDGFFVQPVSRLFQFFVLWKTPYAERFQQELSAFAPVIAGIFSGHLHAPFFHQMTFDKETLEWIGAPAVSPVLGNHSGFQVFSYTSFPLKITDYKTVVVR